MAEVRHIQVDKTDPESGYLELAPVVAEITKVMPKQGYSLIGLRDFAGKEIVALIRGRERPGMNDMGKVAVFALSGKTDGNQVKYSGFYNPKEEIPPEYAGKRPPQPAGEAAGEAAGSGGGRSAGGNRSFALSYAKDLTCAGAITIQQLPGTAIKFNAYLDTGSFGEQKQAPPKKQAQRQRPTQEEDREIPETGGIQDGQGAGGSFDEQYNNQGNTAGGDANTFAGEGSLDDVPF